MSDTGMLLERTDHRRQPALSRDALGYYRRTSIEHLLSSTGRFIALHEDALCLEPPGTGKRDRVEKLGAQPHLSALSLLDGTFGGALYR